MYGESFDDPEAPAAGTRIGVYGYGRGGDFNIGVFGSNNGNGNNNYAALFEGRVFVDGLLQKAAGSFKIDHPDDPANQYLVHSFVESPDMMNIYNGVVRTGADSLAIVELPDYFSSLNKDFRYQLTVVGAMGAGVCLGRNRRRPVRGKDERAERKGVLAGYGRSERPLCAGAPHPGRRTQNRQRARQIPSPGALRPARIRRRLFDLQAFRHAPNRNAGPRAGAGGEEPQRRPCAACRTGVWHSKIGPS